MADQSQLQKPVYGRITVVFDGKESFTINSLCGPLVAVVAEADMFVSGKSVFIEDLKNPPYDLEYYDEERRIASIRRKSKTSS
jgi:hypothetical protein